MQVENARRSRVFLTSLSVSKSEDDHFRVLELASQTKSRLKLAETNLAGIFLQFLNTD